MIAQTIHNHEKHRDNLHKLQYVWEHGTFLEKLR